MNTWLLLITHLTAAAAGGAVAFALTIRYLRARDVDGHIALELNPDHPTGPPHMRHDDRTNRLALVVILASIFLAALGVQAWLAAADNASRDQDLAEQDARDRAYADCLTDFAADLIDTLRTRTDATAEVDTVEAELEDAENRKERTLDRLLSFTAQARATDAETEEQLDPDLVAGFEQALENRIDAQRDYRRIKRQADRVREQADTTKRENPFVYPEAVCSR